MSDSDPSSPKEHRWWQKDLPTQVPPHVLLALCLLGIGVYWALGPLVAYGFLAEPSRKVILALYLIHWSSVGALVQFALSRRDRPRIVLGAIVGAIASIVLMC